MNELFSLSDYTLPATGIGQGALFFKHFVLTNLGLRGRKLLAQQKAKQLDGNGTDIETDTACAKGEAFLNRCQRDKTVMQPSGQKNLLSDKHGVSHVEEFVV